jgi:SRSO17 transposase
VDRPPPLLDITLPSYADYVDRLAHAVGRADRVEPLRSYLGGLSLDGEGKTMRPIPESLDVVRTSARHQSLHHFVAESEWDESAVLRVARAEVLSVLAEVGGPSAWTVTLAGQRKKGQRSVGVARQPLGDGGPPANGQLAVTISLAHPLLSLPISWRLYLPPRWTGRRTLREAARIPRSVRYRTPGQIALDEIDRLLEEGVPSAPVCAARALGEVDRFRAGLSKRGIPYLVEISPQRRLIPVESPAAADLSAGMGRTRSLGRIVETIPSASWSVIPWRDSKGIRHTSGFACRRVRLPALACCEGATDDVATLLVERPLTGRADPPQFWLSTLPESEPIARLVGLAKLAHRVDRDHRELNDKYGLSRFEGRQWRGTHHHAALSIAAYAFWAAQRAEMALEPERRAPAP